MAAIEPSIGAGHRIRQLDYRHSPDLQAGTAPRLRGEYTARLSYTEWGDPSAPAVICLGGIANSARRFDFLARTLAQDFHVLCLDWAGRGASGWLAEQSDYSFDSHVAQVLALIDDLGLAPVTLIGSSFGGSIGMRIAARWPHLVRALVLNDIGPYIPAERRRRRAEAVGRHYVFAQPANLFRRTGAAQKNDGPVDDVVLLHNSFHQTRWSDEEEGRVYRHDIRALLAYREEAGADHVQWDDWAALTCPVLVIHGLLSDALLPDTVTRMLERPGTAVVHVPLVGHTPTLSDPVHTDLLWHWLSDRRDWPQQMTTTWSSSAERILFR